MSFEGRLEAIYIGDIKAQPMRSVPEARAVAGKGIEGDRYFKGAGTYSSDQPWRPDRQVTLVEAEAIEATLRDEKILLDAGDPRRNLVVRGVPLNHLVGREFSVGEVRLRGVKLCEPCKHLEKLTRPGVEKALLHRGGLRAEIVSSGVLRPGDAILPA